jgi:hypothetical protein
MNLLEINQIIQSFEEEHDLLRWKIGNWSAWPVLRFSVALVGANLSIDRTDLRFSLPGHIQQSLKDLARFNWRYHPQVLLSVASTNLVEQQDGRYKDAIFDDLIPYLPGYFKVENINNKHYLRRSHQALYPGNITTSGIQLLANALSKVSKIQSVELAADTFFECINKYLPEIQVSKNYIYRLLSVYYWTKWVFRNLLSRLTPQIVLLQTAYTSHALIAAAKEAHIPVIEFQHGIADRHHPGYSWTTYACAYKDQMQIPDRMYTYGEYWNEELSANGFWKGELRSVGSLRIDQYREAQPQAINDEQSRPTTSKVIVVTTQALDVEALVAFLLEFIKKADMPMDMFIKLHPREADRRPYDHAFAGFSNVHIVPGYDSPSTFSLLSNADYHASIHSTCHYEALGLGTPTIILPFTNYERMLPLCEKASDCAMLVRSPAEMNTIVAQKRLVPKGIADYYFREGALGHIVDEMNAMGISTKNIEDRS